ncbi:MAG: ComF family protein [Sphingobacteriia bacterium]|nr:MAG: ComF family protein [Sphingobacteriia bacterium]
MAIHISNHLRAFQQLFFPHICMGCGADYIQPHSFLCAQCNSALPETNFFTAAQNPVEKIFYGRLLLQAAGAAFYFHKTSLLQYLLIQLKYKSNPDVGRYLGRQVGLRLKDAKRFDDVDLVIPLPLHPKKEFQRGYNQASLIGEGIAAVWSKKLITQAVIRLVNTKTQTQENRISRWQNIEGVFFITQPHLLANQHILLIDDIVTTGASLEACGEAILKIPGVKLSIATVAYTV